MQTPTLTELAARITKIEAYLGMDEAAENTAAQEADDRQPLFWAIEQLAQRHPDPGAVMFAGKVSLPTGEKVQWQQEALMTQLQNDNWADIADNLTAIAHPVRLKLLQAILYGATTAKELGSLPEMGSSGQVYHHLRTLTAAGWLQTQLGGTYQIPPARIIPLLVILMGCKNG